MRVNGISTVRSPPWRSTRTRYASPKRYARVKHHFSLGLNILKHIRVCRICSDCGWQACCELIECWNALGILWSQRADHGKSRDFIQRAIDLYTRVTDSKGAVANPSGDSVASASASSSSGSAVVDLEATRKRLEDLYTHSLFYVAQAYQHLGDAEQAVKYCHMTMNRQLNSGVFDAAVRDLVQVTCVFV